MKPAWELSQVIAKFGQAYRGQYTPNSYQLRVLHAIEHCRTSTLGGHIDRCTSCGHIRISYNSCRNRHCPKCQNTQREAWIARQKQKLLPVPYFHLVFTVPAALNARFLADPRAMYPLLFSCAWQTLSQFFWTTKQAEAGMIALLHTWGQNLSLHPHLHCIVPGGGLDVRGQWKAIERSASGKAWLFPVKNLSRVFRAKFMAALRKQKALDKPLAKQLMQKEWVVFAKDSFAGPQSVVEYLGRYSHKVAISNHRIVSMDDQKVSFRWQDYRDNTQKVMQLNGVEFLRRFCQHILPKGFVRIRHYGLLSSSRLPQVQRIQMEHGIIPAPAPEEGEKDWKQLCRDHLNFDPDLCPQCHKPTMVMLERFHPGRSPPLPKSVRNPIKSLML